MTREELLLLKLGERVQELREQKEMTSLQLAEAADLSIGELTKIEGGKHDPLFDDIFKIIYALKIPVSEFFNFDA